MSIEQGSMRQVIGNIYKILINDEDLMRLLYYFPKDATHFDPLDEELENIKDNVEYWDIVDDRIMLAEKDTDLNDKAICRIYISAGRRRPVFNNYLLTTQEIMISVYTHEKYEKDMRSAWLSDRINELLSLEYIEGTLSHKLEYFGGNPRVAPSQYKRYDHTFEYVTKKK
ncbi:MAG TPA: hypothetical protein VI423_10990 [Paenisporosarcina sp.]|nr:hypothetical protein [Paenisporosarcina sp.]